MRADVIRRRVLFFTGEGAKLAGLGHLPVRIQPPRQASRKRRFRVSFASVFASTVAALLFTGCMGQDEPGVTVTERAVSVREETVTVHTATEPDDPASAPELIEEVESGILRIETNHCAGGGGVGTGFLVAPDLVATAEHVVAGAERIVVKRKGETVSASARVVGADSFRDVALIRTAEPIEGHVFTLSDQEPRLGEEVAALGFPLAVDFPTFDVTVTRGSVSGLDRTVTIDGVERTHLIQTDAAINPGNSGGPLISLLSGEVVAIADAIFTGEAEGFSWGVNVEFAAPLIEQWTENPELVRADSSCAGEPQLALTTFSGEYFSIAYPDSWNVEAGEARKGTYLDTTIRNPKDESVMIRVDVLPEQGNVDPVAAASRNGEILRAQPGYQRLALRRIDFQGRDAVWWEFVVEEKGIALRKVDIFFASESGDVFALLTQSSTPAYELWSPLFDEIRQSLFVLNR